jgi:hypothetical protein
MLALGENTPMRAIIRLVASIIMSAVTLVGNAQSQEGAAAAQNALRAFRSASSLSVDYELLDFSPTNLASHSLDELYGQPISSRQSFRMVLCPTGGYLFSTATNVALGTGVFQGFAQTSQSDYAITGEYNKVYWAYRINTRDLFIAQVPDGSLAVRPLVGRIIEFPRDPMQPWVLNYAQRKAGFKSLWVLNPEPTTFSLQADGTILYESDFSQDVYLEGKIDPDTVPGLLTYRIQAKSRVLPNSPREFLGVYDLLNKTESVPPEIPTRVYWAEQAGSNRWGFSSCLQITRVENAPKDVTSDPLTLFRDAKFVYIVSNGLPHQVVGRELVPITGMQTELTQASDMGKPSKPRIIIMLSSISLGVVIALSIIRFRKDKQTT